MYSDMVLKMLIAMEKMGEPQKTLYLLAFYVGLPLLCLVLLLIDKELTRRKIRKSYGIKD